MIRTNNVPRDIFDASDLTPAERKKFDYLDWDKIDAGKGSASFIRYRGQLLDLGEFMRTDIPGWEGIATDSAFSGTVVRMVENGERAVVGRVYS